MQQIETNLIDMPASEESTQLVTAAWLLCLQIQSERHRLPWEKTPGE